MSQTIGRVWSYYYIQFEIEWISTILAAIIKKLIHHLRETVEKMYLELRDSVKNLLKILLRQFPELKIDHAC